MNGRGRADISRTEPQYVDVIGYVVVAYNEEAELRRTDKFDITPWVIPTYVQDKQFWVEDELKVKHKTEVVVREQLLEHDGYDSYKGYLLVEEIETGNQYYIDVVNFVTTPYWTYSDDLELASQKGYLVAEFNQVSDYYPVTGNKRDEKQELDDGTVVLIVGGNSFKNEIEAIVWKEWRNGYGGVSVYFHSEDLTIIY